MKGKLPWQGIKRTKNLDLTKKIGEKKIKLYDTIFQDIPKCFKYYLFYCRSLKFDEEPDYNYLKFIFEDYKQKNRYGNKFNWKQI